MEERHNPQEGPVELTPKRCRWCGCFYMSPKGARRAGCPKCCPTIMDAIAESEEAR